MIIWGKQVCFCEYLEVNVIKWISFKTVIRKKKKELFLRQLLDTFLEHGAISREQYDKSFGDLIVKMGVREDDGE